MSIHKKAVASFVLLLLFILTPFTLQAATLQETYEGDPLLQEIAEQIEKYYLYSPEEGVEFQSLEEVQEFWQDPHSTYLHEEQFKTFTDSLGRSLSGIGVYLEKGAGAVTVVSTVPGTPAGRAGIQSGDLIVYVDGQSVIDYPLEKVVALLRGESGTTVKVTVRRGELLLDFSLVREHIQLPNLEHELLDDNLLLLRIYNFDSGVARETGLLLQELEEEGVGLKGVILDFRANHGGYVEEALALAELFTGGTLLQVREKGTGWETIEGRNTEVKVIELPVVIMVNKGSASGAEIVAAALKDNGAALLLGNNTFGKGTMQTVMPLKHGGFLKVTIAEFASPDLTPIEGTGIEPHIFVLDPMKQEEMAVLLLGYALQREELQASYLGLLLQQKGEEAKLPQTLMLQGERWYPLRALLSLTGRHIYGEEEWGFYNFTWESIPFRLDLKQRTLSWHDSTTKILLQNGTTYVPLSFLKETLKLPFL